MPAFDGLVTSIQNDGFGWEILFSAPGDSLVLDFTTAPTPNSLAGLTSGSITAGMTMSISYLINGGTITLAPEPSSLVLFASGLLVLGLTLRFGKKVGHPLSA